jgi:hypothetical protein
MFQSNLGGHTKEGILRTKGGWAIPIPIAQSKSTVYEGSRRRAKLPTDPASWLACRIRGDETIFRTGIHLVVDREGWADSIGWPTIVTPVPSFQPIALLPTAMARFSDAGQKMLEDAILL